jgi:MFS transporter, putative metabolite:H+ symporter
MTSDTDRREQRPATRTERLDRLPFTREHRKLLLGSGTGWALDAMDVGLISFVIAALTVQWGLSPDEAGWVASIGFVGMAVGASLGGLLADRVGRRQVFALTLLVYGIATGASALVGALVPLMVLRFVVGLGLGAELPVASTLVSEFAPTRIRGRVVVLLEAFWAVGWFAAALIGFFVVASGDDGWRWGLALGAVPAVYAIVVRRALPESVRFLQSVGRDAEAEQVVRRFEASAGVVVPDGGSVAQDGERSTSAATPPARLSFRAQFAQLWDAEHRVRTAGLWIVWFGLNFAYYGAFIWLPSLLVSQGVDLTRSFGYTVIITAAQLPGYAVAAWLIERWGRRPTLVTFLLGSAIAAFLFALAATAAATGWVVAAGCLLSFFALGAWGALYAVTPEMYPTAVRGSGAGWAAGFGRIASILAPLSVPVLLRVGDVWLVFATFAVAFGAAAAAALLLAERRGIVLAEH